MNRGKIKKPHREIDPDRWTLKEPLFIDLGEAIAIAKEIYIQGGGQVTKEEFSKIVKNSTTSSWFRLKLTAMKLFGLISDTKKESVELTPLAVRITAPHSLEELAEAKLKALTSYSAFRRVAERYLHKPEPAEPSFVANVFERELNIPTEKKDKWAKRFIESARAAGLFRESPLEIRVHSKAEVGDQRRSDTQEQGQQQPLRKEILPEESPSEWLTFEIPVSGKNRPRILIPPGLRRKDFEKMIKVLEALAPEDGEEVKQ